MTPVTYGSCNLLLLGDQHKIGGKEGCLAVIELDLSRTLDRLVLYYHKTNHLSIYHKKYMRVFVRFSKWIFLVPGVHFGFCILINEVRTAAIWTSNAARAIILSRIHQEYPTRRHSLQDPDNRGIDQVADPFNRLYRRLLRQH